MRYAEYLRIGRADDPAEVSEEMDQGVKMGVLCMDLQCLGRSSMSDQGTIL